MAVLQYVCLALWALRVSAGYTFWVDPECVAYFGRGGVSAMVEDVVETAIRTRERLQRSSSDEPQAFAAHENWFKYDLSSPEHGASAKKFKSRWKTSSSRPKPS